MVLHSRGCGRVARRRFTRWGFPSSLRSGNPIFYPRIFCSSSRFFRLTPCGFPEGLFYFPYFLLPSGTPVGLGFRGPRLSILDFHLIPRSPAGAWKSFPLLVFFSSAPRIPVRRPEKLWFWDLVCVPCIKALRLVLWQELRCMTLQRRRVCLPRRSPSPSGIPTK